MSAPESLAPTGPPFACPGCGATDEWRADYYVAVNQGATELWLAPQEEGDPS